MTTKKAVSNLLVSLNKLVNSLSKEDVELIEAGNFTLSINKQKMGSDKAIKHTAVVLEKSKIEFVSQQLSDSKSREEGLRVLESCLKNKSELEVFAKHIDVVVMKNDRIDKIRDNIVDATVGAKLRSSAIQGKKI